MSPVNSRQDIFKSPKKYILFLCLSILILLAACSKPTDIASTNEQLGPPDRVDMVYFYNSDICTCQRDPGDQIQSTLFVYFNGDLTSGKLTFQNIDLVDPENAAIIDKYGAKSQSLFVDLVRGANEQIIAMPEILLVKDDDEALERLIKNRIPLYLSGGQ